MSTKRIKIISISEDSPAEKFGFVKGDILDTCNGNELRNGPDLSRAMSEAKGNAQFRIIRNGGFCTISIPIGKLGIEVVEVECRNELDYAERASEIVNRCNESLGSLISRYKGQNILINLTSPTDTTGALLVNCGNDHFTVFIDGDLLTFPFAQIMSIHESLKFNKLTIIVNQLIVYKGGTRMGIGVGVLVPISSD